MEKNKVLIIDGLNYIYRAVVANFRQDNAVIFNFFRNLRATIELFKPNKCLFVLEGRPKHRYDLYPEYKSNRIVKNADKMNDRQIIHAQAQEIYRLLQHLPVTLVRHQAYEADDVIAFLSINLREEDCTIISSDSDLIQLLQKDLPNLKLYNYKIREPESRYVSPPDYHYLTWKCLHGDKTDNISRLTTATKAERLTRNPEDLSSFLSEQENMSNFQLNKQLISLAEIKNPEEIEFIQPNPDINLLQVEFEKLKFKIILEEPYWTRFHTTFNCLK